MARLCSGRLAFQHLCLCPQWQVLNKAKSHIQELEQNLDNLLKLKGNSSRPAIPISLPGEGWLVFLLETEKLG